MNEPTVTRMFGSDVARPGWQAASDRVDAPHLEAVRSEAAQPARPLPGAAGASVEVETSGPRTRDAVSDAIFPQSYARFAIDGKTHRLSIKIVDAVTDEVLREIPAEQVQRIADELQVLGRRASLGKRPEHAERAAGGGVDRYV